MISIVPAGEAGGRVLSDRGSVTAETAVLLPALVALLVLSLWSISVVGAQLRCVDAARTAARALARGETVAGAVAAARTLAPAGAVVEISRERDVVIVDVHVKTRLPGAGGARGPSIDTGSRAAAAVEERRDGLGLPPLGMP